jgi:hypothetical protein
MRLLVCGSRTWTDRPRLWQVLDRLVTAHGDGQVVLIEGDARGADRLAGQLARERGWRLERYPADWTRHGRAAGFRRNARMLREGRPTWWWRSPSAHSSRAGGPRTWGGSGHRVAAEVGEREAGPGQQRPAEQRHGHDQLGAGDRGRWDHGTGFWEHA